MFITIQGVCGVKYDRIKAAQTEPKRITNRAHREPLRYRAAGVPGTKRFGYIDLHKAGLYVDDRRSF